MNDVKTHIVDPHTSYNDTSLDPSKRDFVSRAEVNGKRDDLPRSTSHRPIPSYTKLVVFSQFVPSAISVLCAV